MLVSKTDYGLSKVPVVVASLPFAFPFAFSSFSCPFSYSFGLLLLLSVRLFFFGCVLSQLPKEFVVVGLDFP